MRTGTEARHTGAGEREAAVSTESVALGYGGPPVLREVDLAIRPGDFWFFLGPNGSGKTTLLRAILGTLRPLEGRLSRDPQVAASRHLGFVPQRCNLHPTLPTTVREFVLLGLAGLRASREEEGRRLAWALERVGLTDMDRRDYWLLSGGQRQRALVARALVRRPRLLLLDEPTNGLDVAAETALLESIDRLNRTEALTVVFVTHDLALAARYARQAALFRDGVVVGGEREATFTSEELTRTYGAAISVIRQPDGTAAIRVNGGAPRA